MQWAPLKLVQEGQSSLLAKKEQNINSAQHTKVLAEKF